MVEARGSALGGMVRFHHLAGSNTAPSSTTQRKGKPMSKTCAFCGRDPYEYVDVGFGYPGVPVAVTCCELGDAAYGRHGDEYTIEISAAELQEISARISRLEWESERRSNLIARLWRKRHG